MYSPERCRLLVIGYGSTLRGDDAVGPRVAEVIERLQLPGVRAMAPVLLTPELAADVAGADSVVFVDATVEGDDAVKMQAITAEGRALLLGHAASPATLLAFARDIFGHSLRAWLITIPVQCFEIGHVLSEKAEKGVSAAVAEVKHLLERL